MTFPPPEVPKLVLIDTSAWTHALRRKSDADIRARVNAIIHACGYVHKARIEHNDKHFDLLQTRFPIY